MAEDREVWTYVAHKDGMFAGAIAGTIDMPGCAKPVTAKEAAAWKREIAKFCGDFIADGFTITPTYSGEEYEALVKDMPMWKRPDKMPEARCSDTPDLFSEA